MAKRRVTVAKDPKGGYDVNVGGRKKSHHSKKTTANKAAKALRGKRNKK